MKIRINNIKFNSFESNLYLQGTVIQGALSYPRVISLSLDYLNPLINKITSDNEDIDFYNDLSSEVILGETYFRFQASKICRIENLEDWLDSIHSTVRWKMIA
jgi:hypothetical protein